MVRRVTQWFASNEDIRGSHAGNVKLTNSTVNCNGRHAYCTYCRVRGALRTDCLLSQGRSQTMLVVVFNTTQHYIQFI